MKKDLKEKDTEEKDYQGYLKDMDTEAADNFWRQLQVAAKAPKQESGSEELLRRVAVEALENLDEKDFAIEWKLDAYEILLIGPLMELVNDPKSPFTWSDAQAVLKKLQEFQLPVSISSNSSASFNDQIELSEEVLKPLEAILKIEISKGKVIGGIDKGDWNKLKDLIEVYNNSNQKATEFEVSIEGGMLVLLSSPAKNQNQVNMYLKMAANMVRTLSSLCDFAVKLAEQNKGNRLALGNSGFLALLQSAVKNPCNNQVAQNLLNCLEKIKRG